MPALMPDWEDNARLLEIVQVHRVMTSELTRVVNDLRRSVESLSGQLSDLGVVDIGAPPDSPVANEKITSVRLTEGPI